MPDAVGIQVGLLQYQRTLVGWIAENPMHPSIIPFSSGAACNAVLVEVLLYLAGPHTFMGKVKNEPYRLGLFFHNVGVATLIGIEAEGVLEVVDWHTSLELPLVGKVCVIRSTLALSLGEGCDNGQHQLAGTR